MWNLCNKKSRILLKYSEIRNHVKNFKFFPFLFTYKFIYFMT